MALWVALANKGLQILSEFLSVCPAAVAFTQGKVAHLSGFAIISTKRLIALANASSLLNSSLAKTKWLQNVEIDPVIQRDQARCLKLLTLRCGGRGWAPV